MAAREEFLGVEAPEDGILKLMVAIEPRSYREAIGTFLQDVREYLDVSVVDPGMLEAQVSRCDPDLVFSSRPNTPSGDHWPAWLEFDSDTYGQSVTFYLDGEYTRIEGADLANLLSIVDRTERSLAESWRGNRSQKSHASLPLPRDVRRDRRM